MLHGRRDEKADRRHEQGQAGGGERTRKPRQLVEQFLEDAVELKPEKDLCAEDEKAAFVEGDLEFAFESHHRLRGDNVIAYAEPTFVGSL